jgi:hypothetical protein
VVVAHPLQPPDRRANGGERGDARLDGLLDEDGWYPGEGVEARGEFGGAGRRETREHGQVGA